VARRAVVELRIDEVFDLGDGPPVGALPRIQQARRSQQRGHLVFTEHDACRDCVRGARGAVGLRDPIGGHERVGIRRRHERAEAAGRSEPRGSRVHHPFSRGAHVRDCARQVGARNR